MTFAEKLVFLMNLTSTSNKQLAEAVNVDPSLISRLRNARRGAPRNLAYAQNMAVYFAKKCEGKYQRAALAEAMGRKHLPAQMDAGQLASVLFDFLTDSRDQAGPLPGAFTRFSLVERTGAPGQSPPAPPTAQSPCYVFYGNEGKRGAITAFFSHLLACEGKGTILLCADESAEWLWEEPAFQTRMKAQMLRLLRRGYRILRIGAPLNTADDAFDTLSIWLPLYATGQVEGFYYPRLRDELCRRTLVVAPGVAAVTSASVSGRAEARATMLTFDPRLTNAFSADFQDLLDKCKPLMTTYVNPGDGEALLGCISQFESDRGDRIQMSTTLSSITTPISLVRHAARSAPPAQGEAIVQALSKAQDMFRRSLSQYEAIDIHTLAAPARVRAGEVPMGVSYLGERVFYTPRTYAQHLQNIGALLEAYPRYHAVFLPQSADACALMVKQERQALLLRPEVPLTIFEIAQPAVAEACRDYLTRRAHSALPPALRRQDALVRIRQTIRALGTT